MKKLNSKLTGGLAWAGLIVVLAVPSADLLTKSQAGSATRMTSDMDAVETASVAAPAPIPATRKATTDDPVEEYVSSGKKLPSYISDAPVAAASSEPAAVPRLVVPTVPATAAKGSGSKTVEVAAIEPSQPVVAPAPYPASMRPKAPVATRQIAAPTVNKQNVAPTVIKQDPAPVVAGDEAPLILDEDLVARREAAVARVLESEPLQSDPGGIVTGDQLEEWDSGSLAEYLERRGLISESGGQQAGAEFDRDGFFLSDGPNGGDRRLIRRQRREDFFLF